MDNIEFLVRIIAAFAIGGLIGLERERTQVGKIVVAGVRTFPLVAISGCVVAMLAIEFNIPFILHVGLIIFGALAIALFYIRHQLEMTGLTTSVAFVVTFLAGALIGYGYLFGGIVIGVATTALLLSKARLHKIAHILTDEEIFGAIQFAAVAFILLPLTINLQPIKVFGYELIGRNCLFDPYWILLIVIFVSAISFASFLTMRHLKPRRGLFVTGLFGGLVNSEATTVSLSMLARGKKKLYDIALGGILLANASMLARNALIIAFADPHLNLLKFVIVPLIIIGVVNLLLILPHRKTTEEIPEIKLKSPFALKPAFIFAGLFALVAAAAYVAQKPPVSDLLGPYGIFLVAIGSFVSSGAVVASLAALVYVGEVAPLIAAETAILACVVSTLNKILLARFVSKKLATKCAPSILIVVCVGILAIPLMCILF